MTTIPKVTIFGVPVSKLGFQDTIELLTEWIERRQPTQVVTANPIIIMSGLEDPAFMNVLQHAEIVVPDGAGLVWAASYVGNPVVEKVAGIELMQELLHISEQRGWRPYFLGTSQDNLEAALHKIRTTYPKLDIAGYRDGYFRDADDRQVITDIREAKPDLLFVGRAANNQEPWIGKYKQELQVPLMMGVGGSFDVLSGKLKRAPKLWIRLRLEWLYRLLQEPKRYRRMLILPRFAWKVIREKSTVQRPYAP